MIQILHSLDNSVTESDSVVIELRSFWSSLNKDSTLLNDLSSVMGGLAMDEVTVLIRISSF
ncbi:hypothetical protein [Vaccinia virus]|uniref:Uncharacterized protein n=1 Tax=Vaccinia virus TaxID=10245 RepID=A0A2I6J1Q2_VACCV|nr:hypothetical protein [Vaccinia virus]